MHFYWTFILAAFFLSGCGDDPCSHTPTIDTPYDSYEGNVSLSTDCNQVGKLEPSYDTIQQVLPDCDEECFENIQNQDGGEEVVQR